MHIGAGIQDPTVRNIVVVCLEDRVARCCGLASYNKVAMMPFVAKFLRVRGSVGSSPAGVGAYPREFFFMALSTFALTFGSLRASSIFLTIFGLGFQPFGRRGLLM